MSLRSKVESLEKHNGRKRGRLHIHYEGQPCRLCETCGPPTAEDTVITVVHENKAQKYAENVLGTR